MDNTTAPWLFFNNLLIWLHVRKQMQKKDRRHNPYRKTTFEEEMVEDSLGDEADGDNISIAGSLWLSEKKLPPEAQRSKKADMIRKRRLNLARSQAFLYVGSFIFCKAVTQPLRYGIGGSVSDYVEAMELPYKYYNLLVIQSILQGLQGFFNMLVYVRPKYLVTRREFPQRTRLWAYRHAILGDEPAGHQMAEDAAVTEGIKHATQKHLSDTESEKLSDPSPLPNHA